MVAPSLLQLYVEVKQEELIDILPGNGCISRSTKEMEVLLSGQVNCGSDRLKVHGVDKYAESNCKVADLVVEDVRRVQCRVSAH
jgi:hypothetical protein